MNLTVRWLEIFHNLCSFLILRHFHTRQFEDFRELWGISLTLGRSSFPLLQLNQVILNI